MTHVYGVALNDLENYAMFKRNSVPNKPPYEIFPPGY